LGHGSRKIESNLLSFAFAREKTAFACSFGHRSRKIGFEMLVFDLLEKNWLAREDSVARELLENRRVRISGISLPWIAFATLSATMGAQCRSRVADVDRMERFGGPRMAGKLGECVPPRM
jgi:hypothetical protein